MGTYRIDAGVDILLEVDIKNVTSMFIELKLLEKYITNEKELGLSNSSPFHP